MDIVELKKQVEQDIQNYIAQKINEINEASGLHVSDIDLIPIEEIQGLKGCVVEIKLR